VLYVLPPEIHSAVESEMLSQGCTAPFAKDFEYQSNPQDDQ